MLKKNKRWAGNHELRRHEVLPLRLNLASADQGFYKDTFSIAKNHARGFMFGACSKECW